jgi:hypothetical protein
MAAHVYNEPTLGLPPVVTDFPRLSFPLVVSVMTSLILLDSTLPSRVRRTRELL